MHNLCQTLGSKCEKERAMREKRSVEREVGVRRRENRVVRAWVRNGLPSRERRDLRERIEAAGSVPSAGRQRGRRARATHLTREALSVVIRGCSGRRLANDCPKMPARQCKESRRGASANEQVHQEDEEKTDRL